MVFKEYRRVDYCLIFKWKSVVTSRESLAGESRDIQIIAAIRKYYVISRIKYGKYGIQLIIQVANEGKLLLTV